MRPFGKKFKRLFKRVVLFLAAAIVISFVSYRVVNTLGPIISPYVATSMANSAKKITNLPPVTPLSPDVVTAAINRYRQDNNLVTFNPGETMCSIIDVIPEDPNLADDKAVFDVCPTCSRIALLSISKLTPEANVLTRLQETDTKKLLDDTRYTHICAKEKTDQILVVFAAYENRPTPAVTAKSTPLPQKPPINFTEDQIWQAFMDYRNAHRKNPIAKNENLCVYARKRIDDHLNMFKTLKSSQYPNPDKYPLDAHAGFQKDAESGYVFEVTGRNRVAENLAYWPDAQYPHQVIEWGWDTSTEGHREAQLSNDYTDACISGKEGFFVAIFGI